MPGYPGAQHWRRVPATGQHYVDIGTGAPVLLLHGHPSAATSGATLLTELAPHQRCVAPDLPGLGLSPRPGFPAGTTQRFESQLAALDSLMSCLTVERGLPTRDWTFVLHDWGGPLRPRLAAPQPRRRRPPGGPQHRRFPLAGRLPAALLHPMAPRLPAHRAPSPCAPACTIPSRPPNAAPTRALTPRPSTGDSSWSTYAPSRAPTTTRRGGSLTPRRTPSTLSPNCPCSSAGACVTRSSPRWSSTSGSAATPTPASIATPMPGTT
ncbi:alpha/beta fold hydrolase [Streptomyces sp. URMC 126]|uniref:alpha/beta fold hydrolase n=1 Tax=Streptomyces sp. URMC 126 TaxID=3423401 RepID=UPI003F1D240D